MYKFHIDAHEGVEGVGGSQKEATRGGSGTGRRAEVMHFGFPQMNKIVPHIPPLPPHLLAFPLKR